MKMTNWALVILSALAVFMGHFAGALDGVL